MTIEPEKLWRAKRNGKPYEVLEELYQMWRQADEALDNLVNPLVERTEIQLRLRARNVWEEAIMVYTGWDGLELERWFQERAADNV